MGIDILKNSSLVFIGGGFGACARYCISLSVLSFGHRPWIGTLIANLLGCTIFFLLERFEVKDPQMNLLLRTGKLGSLTTFSTFTFEVVTLMKSGQYLESSMVFALNIVFGLLIGFFILK
jgi:CrcB protein